ncbi:hypothetical protein BD310DRAFT_785140, partial [Dichomitus squalens]
DIVCVINVQHDCSRARCTTDGKKTIRQEREDTTQSRTVVSHTNSTLYVVNLQALHNQHWMRLTLPDHLRTRPVFFTERAVLHQHAAASLRNTK